MSDKLTSSKYDDYTSHLLRPDQIMNAETTLHLYQQFYQTDHSQGPSLPSGKADSMRFLSSLTACLDHVDGLILDSYGVIGLGTAPIDGIQAFFAQAQKRNIPIVILTNGASQPAAARVAGYQSWDLPIIARDIISSRDACFVEMQRIRAENPNARFSYLGHHVRPFAEFEGALIGDDNRAPHQFDEADYYIFMGAIGWHEEHQALLQDALHRSQGTVIVANPDISAPQADGFSFEPGFWAMKAQNETGCPLILTGKPYASAFELAFAALQEKAGYQLDKNRVGMVGDSLHTDILGANHFGLTSILLSGYGLLKGYDITQITSQCQIYPDIIVPII